MSPQAEDRATTPPRFPGLPFWLDDDPARALRAGLERAGIRAWATGACVRDAVLGTRAFAPPVVEILAAGDRSGVEAAIGLSGLAKGPDGPGGDRSALSGATRFVLRPIGDRAGDVPPAAADLRRDFTANAILCGLDGTLLDPAGGLADLAAHRVRLAYPAALRDDPVRVVRLARMRVLLGEEDPDPEALAEAGIYGADVASCPPDRILTEMGRLLSLWPAARLVPALRWLDGLCALDGVALVPAIDLLERFLVLAESHGLEPHPLFSLGVLGALKLRGGCWIDGVRPRFGDARDALSARPCAILSSAPSGDDEPLAPLLRAAAGGD